MKKIKIIILFIAFSTYSQALEIITWYALELTDNDAFDFFFNVVFSFTIGAFIIRAIINVILGRRY